MLVKSSALRFSCIRALPVRVRQVLMRLRQLGRALGPDQSIPDGVANEIGERLQLELVHDLGAMSLGGSRADA